VTTFHVPFSVCVGTSVGVACGDGVAVGTIIGVGVRVGGLFEAASTDDVPLTSINTINPTLRSEVPMSDNL
jgi:hypothetical protein